jgi:hypothetical protein
MHLCPITGSRSMTGLGAVRFHGARRRRHDWVALGPRQGSGRAATAYPWPDLLATTALWLVVLVAMTLIFTQRANPHYQRRAATRAATPANGTGANVP